MWSATVCTAALALGFFTLDWWEARSQQMAAEQAADWIADRDGGPHPVWYVGHWGFQFYAERREKRRQRRERMMRLMADEKGE